MENKIHVELEGKVALVTGSSRGLGRAMALGLAAHGADIVVNYHKHEDAADQVKKNIEAMGRNVIQVKADVSKKGEVTAMVATALDTFGKIDILINNAGIFQRVGVSDMSEDIWDQTINTNLKGVFLCSQAVLKSMIANNGGRIINMTSGRGVAGQLKGAHYSASKGGIIAFTKSLALEVASDGINVNAIAPGATDTDMWRDSKTPEEIEQKLKVPRIPSGIGSPEDLVGTAVYLSTEASKFITGQVIFFKTP